MPHVDEGTLHALLDGALRAEDPARAAAVEAHLQACPDCRALAGEAAETRAAVGRILDATEPDIRPDFQEVLVRAGGTLRQEGADDRASRLRRHARTTRAAAWAATVVLALGTGYLIRDRLVTDTSPTTTARVDAAEARGTPTGDAAARTEARPTPAAPDRTAPDRTAPERAAPERAAEAPARAAAREPEPPRVAGARTDDAAAVGATVGEARIAEAGMEAAEDGPTAHREDVELRRVVPAPELSLALEAMHVAAEWRDVTPDDARALVDGTLLVLRDAEIISLQALGTGARARVRSVQRLDGGLDLQVLQWRIDAPARDRDLRTEAAEEWARVPDADPDMPDDARSVTVQHGPYAITVTGALPVDALQALAEAASARERD
jgi:hypothetical protein